MERQRNPDDDRFRLSADADGLPSGDSLDQRRAEIDELLRASDHVFDSLNSLQAQEYLQQNLQRGGQ